jgi:hypothetical protein
MLSPVCLFCNHVNAPNSKFCAQCGSPLHLMPCVQCGTINNLTARKCRNCNADFPGRRTTGSAADPVVTLGQAAVKDRFGPSSLAGGASGNERLKADAPRAAEAHPVPLPDAPVLLGRAPRIALASRLGKTKRRRSALIVSGVALAGFAVAGSYIYQQAMIAGEDIGAPDAEWRRGASVGYRGAIGRQDPDTASDAVPAASAVPTVPASPIASPSVAPAVEQVSARVAPGERGVGQAVGILGAEEIKKFEPLLNRAAPPAPFAPQAAAATDKRAPPARNVPESAASAIAAPVPRPNPAEAFTRLERQSPRIGPCTEAVAALGLCTPEPKQAAR